MPNPPIACSLPRLLRALCLVLLLLSCIVAALPVQAAGQVVRAGLEQNPPLSYLDEDRRPAGLLVELLNEIARREGWELQYIPGSLQEGLDRLERRELDLFVTLAYTPERDERFDFNHQEVVLNYGQVFIHEGNVNSIFDLQGKSVAVAVGDIHNRAFRSMAEQFRVGCRFVEVKNFREVFEALAAHTVDAGVVGRLYGIRNEQRYHLRETPVVFNPIKVMYAAPQGKHDDLLATIDRYLVGWKEDHDSLYYRLLEKYLGIGGRQGNGSWYRWLIAGSVLLVALFGVRILVWRRRFRQSHEQLQSRDAQLTRTEQALQETEEKYRGLMENSGSIILRLDLAGRITSLNEYAEQFFGYGRDELLGQFAVGSIVPLTEEGGRDLAAHIGDLVAHPESYPRTENQHQRKDGSTPWVSWSNQPLRNERGEVVGVLAIGQDVTERRAYEEQLLHQATHDPLTGLSNRALLSDRLNQLMSIHSRNDWLIALLVLDLDNFQLVNETYGHKAGDELLRLVADRLRYVLRRSDTLARLSGDEFIILPAKLDGSGGAILLAEKLQATLLPPFQLQGREIFVTASIGIALYPHDGDSVELLLQRAEMAMHEAKREGKNRLHFYTEEMNSRVQTRLVMETSLRRALERKEFLLLYQPQVEFDSGRITAVEALLRWRPQGGEIIPPNDFIPLLEETGLIVAVGEWVLETACRQLVTWHQEGLDLPLMSVNISPRHFQYANIVDQVANVLHDTGLDPHCLRLELTEGIIMHDTAETSAKLAALQAMGITFSLDDFGTGYSSLGYLRRLPISELKIDRSFVSNLPDNWNDAVIVNTIIGIADSLNLHVVAEGVETEEQRLFLDLQKCRAMQGFFFSRPVPPTEIARLLKEQPGSGS